MSLEKTIAVLETTQNSEQAQNITDIVRDVQSKHCEQTYSNNEMLNLKCIQKWNDFFSFIKSPQEERRNQCLQYKIQHDQSFKDMEGMEFNLEWCLKGLYLSAH